MKYLIVFFVFFTHLLQAQNNFSGIVLDNQTRKPLAFATIKSNADKVYLTDIDGKFSFTDTKKLSYFTVNYSGYLSKKILVFDNAFYNKINLEPNPNYVANNNGYLLIKNVIANKNRNNPEKKLNSFKFKSYNKLIVSANPDSLKGNLDSIFVIKKNLKYFSKIDSSEYKFKKIISKQHLFQTEKTSEFQFINKKLKETVIGLKMSGFKQPVYEILGFNLQSFSVYDNQYELFQTKYKSPISDDVVSDYQYQLLDTIVVNNRKTFAIYFKNRKKVNESGLEGLLYSDANNYAVAKCIMRVKNVLDISGIHEFVYIESEDLWFPVAQKFKIIKGKNNEDIKLFGGTIQFDSDLNNDEKPREKHSSDFVYLLSETSNSEIYYNTVFKIKKAAIAIEVKDDAINKPDIFWNLYRKDSLDIRGQKTYLTLDSLVVKKRIENRFLFGKKIVNGFLPFYLFDVDLRKAFNYNNYEGFRLCFGGTTNEKLSRKFKIDGYTAYGTKDGNFKYNIGVAARYGKFSNTWFGASYTDDIQQIASTNFAIDNKQFKLIDTDLFNFSSFYNYVKSRVFLETKIIPKTESIWELSHTIVDPKFDYLFRLNDRFYNLYNMTTAMVSLQWNPFSSYLQTPVGRIESKVGYPKFTFQVTKSLPSLLKNDFNFGKFDFKSNYERKFLNGQKTSLMFAMGYAIGDIPITHLYNNSPNSLNKDKLLQRTTIEGDNDFETMYFNEFFSNEYAFFEIRHELKKFNIAKKFKPYLVFITRTAIGNISKPEQHFGIAYKTLDKGYFESGLQINQLFKGLGLSTFFRYGPNQLPDFEDNLALRISYYVDLGF